METLYTPAEVADKLKLKKTTIYDLIKRGELPSSKVGKQLRISSTDLERYLRQSQPGCSLAGESGVLPFIISGQAALLDMLCALVSQRLSEQPVLRAYQNSYNGLTALYFEKVQATVCGLWREEQQTFDLSLLQHFLPGADISAIHLCRYRLGLYVPKGNPKQLHSLLDISSRQLCLAGREKGSEARRLCDTFFKTEAPSFLRTQELFSELSGSLATASAVASGIADAGIGEEAACLSFPSLEFIPLETNSLELVFYRECSWLRDLVLEPEFKTALSLTAGYDTSETGRILI